MSAKAGKGQNPKKWSRSTRLWVMLILLVIIGWIFIVSLPVIEALLIAGLLAFLVDPTIQWTMRHLKMKREKASAIVYIFFLLIFASIPAGLGTLVYGFAKTWFSDFPAAAAELERFFSQPVDILGFTISPSIILEDLRQSLTEVLKSIPGGSLNVLSGLTTNLMWLLLILVSLFYFMKDGPKLRQWIISFVLPEYNDEIERLLDELVNIWGVFLRAQILIFFIIGLLIGISSLVVIWLYQTGLIRFSTIGLIVVLVIIYTLIQQVDNVWLRPQLMGRQLQLHPGVVFVGLIGAFALSGILGALLIVPSIASANLLARYAYNKMLGYPAWPEVLDQSNEEENKEKEIQNTQSP